MKKIVLKRAEYKIISGLYAASLMLYSSKALLAASLHGFPSLYFRENFKKVKKSILQQLPFPYMFPMIATVLPNALRSTVHLPFNCLF
jgi:hypothetical protein